MITSVFKKSTPINLIFIVVLVLVFFFLGQLQNLQWTQSIVGIAKTIVNLILLLTSLLLTDFIAKKNGLTKESSYTLLFYFLFLLFFPAVLANTTIIVSAFFVLLAIRRLISLQTLKSSKEKIFDASLLIFLASMFHFWSILYLVLVFISIIFHASRDYKNWILPFIALLAASIIALVLITLLDLDYLNVLQKQTAINLKLNHFTNNYQNISFSIFVTVALFFVISMFALLPNKALILHASYKKLVAAFFIGIIIFVISNNKTNDMLLFCFGPLAIMATNHIELKQAPLKQEMVLGVLILCSLFCFFSQL